MIVAAALMGLLLFQKAGWLDAFKEPKPAASQSTLPKAQPGDIWASPDFSQPFQCPVEYLPVSKGTEKIEHFAFTLGYAEEHEQAAWVLYRLHVSMLEQGTVKRSNDFRPDPTVSTLSASLADYRRSGFDRGHLVPAADMKWSERAMSETFYLSNISPQRREFNEGIWLTLEEKVRKWARKYGDLLVIAGPVYHSDGRKPTMTIGDNHVAVPDAFYKIVLREYGNPQSAVAYIIPNSKGAKAWQAHAVTVRDVEKATGIDFFQAMDDALEEALETTLAKW